MLPANMIRGIIYSAFSLFIFLSCWLHSIYSTDKSLLCIASVSSYLSHLSLPLCVPFLLYLVHVCVCVCVCVCVRVGLQVNLSMCVSVHVVPVSIRICVCVTQDQIGHGPSVCLSSTTSKLHASADVTREKKATKRRTLHINILPIAFLYRKIKSACLSRCSNKSRSSKCSHLSL